MDLYFSILLVVIGLAVGFVAAILFNAHKENSAKKNAEAIIERFYFRIKRRKPSFKDGHGKGNQREKSGIKRVRRSPNPKRTQHGQTGRNVSKKRSSIR